MNVINLKLFMIAFSVHLGGPAIGGLALGRSNMPQGQPFAPFGNIKRSEMPKE